jgi:hypothetical protein
MFTVTFFEDIYAKSLRAETFTTLEELGGVIVDTHAPTKEALPLLKFGRFGTVRTPAPNNCLRTDQNVLMTTGIEGDHDAGTMPFQEAVDRLEAAGFAFLIYTTPSHTPGKPRWRVLAQLSKEVTPAERARLMTWLNGILGGVLSRESWGISQAFYYGQVDGAPSFELHVGLAERSIDEADFEAIAQPYRPAPGAAAGQGSKARRPISTIWTRPSSSRSSRAGHITGAPPSAS